MEKSQLFAEILKNDKKCIYCGFIVEWLEGAVAIGDKYAHRDCAKDAQTWGSESDNKNADNKIDRED